jgi:hypothetical protein
MNCGDVKVLGVVAKAARSVGNEGGEGDDLISFE